MPMAHITKLLQVSTKLQKYGLKFYDCFSASIMDLYKLCNCKWIAVTIQHNYYKCSDANWSLMGKKWMWYLQDANEK